MINFADVDLEINSHGIYSNKKNKIISNLIKFNQSMYYDIYFSSAEYWGEELVFETNTQYKKYCYLPIKEIEDAYYVNSMICFSLAINYDSTKWFGTSYFSDKLINLKELSVDDIQSPEASNFFILMSNVEGVIDSNSKELIFENLDYAEGENKYSLTYRFKVDDVNHIYLNDKSVSMQASILDKTYLYLNPNEKEKTKIYLIKDNKVTILDTQINNANQKWYFINYKGKKDINMWIKAEAIELNKKL